jgi:type IV secretory pathway VirB2 component (pilin)
MKNYISTLKTPAIALTLLAVNTPHVWAAGAGLPWESSATSVYNSFKGPVAWSIGGGGLVAGLVAHHYSAQLEQVFHSTGAKVIGLAGGLGVVGLMATLFGGAGALI